MVCDVEVNDKIIVKDARFFCRLGVSAEERAREQEVFVSVILFCDTKKAAGSDCVDDTINYARVCQNIGEVITGYEHCLVETIAEKIVVSLFKNFDVKKVCVRIKKPRALKNARYAGVEVIREVERG